MNLIIINISIGIPGTVTFSDLFRELEIRRKWCIENIGDTNCWQSSPCGSNIFKFYFTNKEDALAFMLVWGGERDG